MTRRRLRATPLAAWAHAAPALALALAFLVLPAADTAMLSLRDARGGSTPTLANYTRLAADAADRRAIANSLLWVVLFPASTLGLGLVLAVATDGLRYGAVVRALLFLPMALSFTAGAVIWRLVCHYEPAGAPQTGLANAIAVRAGWPPVAWLQEEGLATATVMAVAVWTWTGFAVLLIAAGLRGIPPEILDAARADGATPWQAFRLVVLPALRPALLVTAVTLGINALKVFDLVYVLTSGLHGTDVVATRMFTRMFVEGDAGAASGLATLLLVAVLPLSLGARHRGPA